MLSAFIRTLGNLFAGEATGRLPVSGGSIFQPTEKRRIITAQPTENMHAINDPISEHDERDK